MPKTHSFVEGIATPISCALMVHPTALNMQPLFARESLRTGFVGRTGISRKPRLLDVTDADVRTVSSVVAGWADQGPAGQVVIPQTMPTPYNPSPFSNLPSPPP